MPEPIIHIEHLSRFFGTVKAVDDLSLEVPAGIVFGFLGPNGAGKTTTIHLLLGLLEPTKGQARVLALIPAPRPMPFVPAVGRCSNLRDSTSA